MGKTLLLTRLQLKMTPSCLNYELGMRRGQSHWRNGYKFISIYSFSHSFLLSNDLLGRDIISLEINLTHLEL